MAYKPKLPKLRVQKKAPNTSCNTGKECKSAKNRYINLNITKAEF